MLKALEDTLNKSCLIGLTYFDVSGKQLKQTLLAGRVKSVDKEMGITLSLLGASLDKEPANKSSAEFILPANLSCWFKAPKGDFHTSQTDVKITDPDFLVTWDIHQTKDTSSKQEGEQQWWQWVPRTADPKVN